MAGLTPTGLEIKTVETILSEIEDQQRTDIATDLDTSSESVIGQLNAIVTPKLRELWELLEVVYKSRDRASASFSALDVVLALTGTKRGKATPGHVLLEVQLNAGTTLPGGAVANVSGQPDNRWYTQYDVQNTGGSSAWIQVPGIAVTAGLLRAYAMTITQIATPFTGWTAVRNPDDAAAGTNADNDVQARLRGEEELSAAGTATLPAIRRDLLTVQNVIAVTVDENQSAFPDAFGRPPKSIEAVVQFTTGLSGGDLGVARQLVAQQLWESAGGGIDLYGSHSATVTDANGQNRVMRWNEPGTVNLYATITIQVDAGLYAGDAAVKQAVADFGQGMKMGDDVIRAKVIAAMLQVPGVLDVIDVTLGASGGVQRDQNLIVPPRSFASFDTAHVIVVHL